MAQVEKNCLILLILFSIITMCSYITMVQTPIGLIGPFLWRQISASGRNLQMKPKFDKLHSSSHGNSGSSRRTGKSSLARSTHQRLQATKTLLSIRSETRNMPNSNISSPTGVSSSLKTNQSYRCRQCKPRQTIVFVKTHKTGSTTLSRIIDVYGYEHSLSFVRELDKKERSFHRSNQRFNRMSYRTFIPPPGVQIGNYEKYKYNILTLHVRYTRDIFDNFMQPNPVYISILREPSKQFESAFNFFSIGDFVPGRARSMKMEAFLLRPRMYIARINLDKRPYLHNNQIYDFGLDEKNFNDMDFINNMISQLEKEMDLVLINEFYEQSLVLLSKTLCWDLQDMIYLSTNQRPKEMRTKVRNDLRTKIRRWNSADVRLYDHFVKRLHERIAEYGPAFADDLATFKRLQSNFRKKCSTMKSKKPRTSKPNLNVSAQSRCDYFFESADAMNTRLRKSMG